MGAFLKFARFKDCNTWSVHLLLNDSIIYTNKFLIVPFKEFTKKASIEKIQIQDNKTYKILGVRTYGLGVFINREIVGSALTMKTYQKAKTNHLYWCKVDTKNGAFGIITDKFEDGIGSSNMNFAELDTKKIYPDYLQLFFKSKKFNYYMDSMVIGTTNRKYIKFNDLLNDVKIPLPPLDIQKKIVQNYQDKLSLALKQEQEAKNKDKEIEEYLYKELKIEIIDNKTENEILNFVRFKDMDRWDTQSNSFNLNQIKSKFDFIKIAKLIQYSQYGLSEKANLNTNNIPMLRMNNIINSEIDTFSLKYINLTNGKFENYILQKNDVLFNRTNSKELVGKCAVFKLNGIYSFASYLIRLKLNINLIEPNYFVYILNSSIGRKQIDAISRQITGQVNINAEELKNFVMPLPSLKIQNTIVQNIQKIKDAINLLRESSIQNKALALQEFEREVFNIDKESLK